LMGTSIASGAGLKASELARESMDQFLEIDIAQINWKHENNQMLSDLRQSLQDYIDSSGTVDATMRQYDQAQRDLFAVQAEGDRLQKQRLVFRQRAAALVQGEGQPPLRCRILRREWNAPRGRLTIQLGRPGWVTNFAVPEWPQPGQVREAVTQVLAGHGVPGSLRPEEMNG